MDNYKEKYKQSPYINEKSKKLYIDENHRKRLAKMKEEYDKEAKEKKLNIF